MTSNKLVVNVRQRTLKNGETYVEGSYQLPNSTVAKLAKSDGSTQYATRSTLNQTARRLAAVLNMELEYKEQETKKVVKKTAKQSTPVTV